MLWCQTNCHFRLTGQPFVISGCSSVKILNSLHVLKGSSVCQCLPLLFGRRPFQLSQVHLFVAACGLAIFLITLNAVAVSMLIFMFKSNSVAVAHHIGLLFGSRSLSGIAMALFSKHEAVLGLEMTSRSKSNGGFPHNVLLPFWSRSLSRIAMGFSSKHEADLGLEMPSFLVWRMVWNLHCRGQPAIDF